MTGDLYLKGYVKLYRKILANPVFKSPELLQLFIYCLLRANHEEGKAFSGNDEVTIEPGQFVTGRFELAKDLKQNESSIYKRLKRLETLHILALNSNNKNTLVTIVNWELYQSAEKESNSKRTPKEQQSNNEVTTEEQQSNNKVTQTRMKECKNERMKEEKIYKQFHPPTIKEVQAYCLERNKGVNPEKWYDHYTSNGWKVGKNSMKDWKAAVRTWEDDKPKEKSKYQDLSNYYKEYDPFK